MNKDSHVPMFSCFAYLWDGNRQLSGKLELWKEEVIFKFVDFKYSHLSLSIPLVSIKKIEEYLIFDLAKNGLKIQNHDGHYDLFVLDDGQVFKKMVLAQMK